MDPTWPLLAGLHDILVRTDIQEKLAGMAQRPEKRENLPELPPEKQGLAPAIGETFGQKFSTDQILAAQLLATGMERAAVARQLVGRLGRNVNGSKALKLKVSRQKVRNWQENPKFLDMVYHYAVLELDKHIPRVFNGILRKAEAGRVDAAKLILEVSGRHAPNTDVVPAQIVLNFGSMARPEAIETDAHLPGPEDTVDAEWDEV